MKHANIKFLSILIPLVFFILFGCTQNHKKVNQGKNKNNDKNIWEFVSTNNDLEEGNKIVQTKKEATYHTFNFNKNIISIRSQSKTEDWLTFEYKIKERRTIETLGGSVFEFDIDSPICNQVWIDASGSLGYELTNGQTIVFYDVKEIE